MATLKAKLNGPMDRDDLKRLLWPVAWSGTVDPTEAHAEELELRDTAREALEALDEAELYSESDSELVVFFKDGEISEIGERD